MKCIDRSYIDMCVVVGGLLILISLYAPLSNVISLPMGSCLNWNQQQ